MLPTHAYLGLSPGLGFETKIFAKTNAAELLRKELAAPGYRVSTISIGANTDPYQPAERELKITRGEIEVLAECQHPFGIVNKNALIERDIDPFLEETVELAREAGATMAGYVMLRLPYEVAPLMRDWLAAHYPQKAEHIMSLVQQMRGGKDYDATFGRRQRGTGEFADLIATRFRLACRRLGFNGEREPLDVTGFRPPRASPQLDLF